MLTFNHSGKFPFILVYLLLYSVLFIVLAYFKEPVYPVDEVIFLLYILSGPTLSYLLTRNKRKKTIYQYRINTSCLLILIGIFICTLLAGFYIFGIYGVYWLTTLLFILGQTTV